MKKLLTLFAVAAMAFSAQADILTVAQGQGSWGALFNSPGHLFRAVYSSSLLTDMQDCAITEVTFNNAYYHLYNSKVELRIFELSENNPDVYTDDMIPAATQSFNSYGYRSRMTFSLEQPYIYNGGYLCVEFRVVEADFDNPNADGWVCFWGTYDVDDCSTYRGDAYNFGNSSMATTAIFTYEPVTTPVEPTEKTGAPTFNGYTTDGIHAYFVEILPSEPSTIWYRVRYPDGTYSEWAVYEDILSFTEDGMYRVEAYAIADGKLQSDPIAYEFVVNPATGLSELVGNKTVASTRYFNMTGQEMQEANGLTIVVTTYTDGTTSSVKVMK